MQSFFSAMFLPSQNFYIRIVENRHLTTSHLLFNIKLKRILCSITNICLDEAGWAQATLPIWFGGLGICSAVHLAPSTFLASMHNSQSLVCKIFPPRLQSHSFLCMVTSVHPAQSTMTAGAVASQTEDLYKYSCVEDSEVWFTHLLL